MVKVSILISYYNYRKFVYQAIESIYSQTFKDFEVLVINEGNERDFDEIRKKYPIKVLNKKDEHNLAKVWNFGIRRAKGKYIKFLDSDDILLPECLEREVEVLDNNPKVGLVCAHSLWKIESRSLKTWKKMVLDGVKAKIRKFTKPEYREYSNSEIITKGMFMTGNPISIPTVMIRRECGFFDENVRFGEDFEFWIRIAQKWEIRRLRKNLAIYRVHGSQQTVKRTWSDQDLKILNATKRKLFEKA